MVQSGIIPGVNPDVLRCVEVKVTTVTCEDEHELPRRDLLDIQLLATEIPLCSPARLITALI